MNTVRFSSTDQFAEAEKAYEEALGIYRRLAQTNPIAYEAHLIQIRKNLENLLESTH
jgi:hypothetical protein